MISPDATRPAVLFVCLGNICRSPMAEGAFRRAAAAASLDCIVDSAGTADYHIGEAPDHRAISVARADGVDIGGLLGRQIVPEDFTRFTHILAMDKANIQGIKARAPRHGSAQIALILDVLPDRAGHSVADPYYGDAAGFEECWRIVNEAAEALARRLAAEGAEARL